MKILVLGATGHIGTGLVRHAVSAGHHVVGLARSPQAAAAVQAAGAEPREIDTTEPTAISAAVTADIEAVIQAGGDSLEITAALLAPLRGTGRTFTYTSGIWIMGERSAQPATEASTPSPIAKARWRVPVENFVLSAAADTIRTAVVRPGIVYGDNKGIPQLYVDWAARNGAGRYVGTPAVHWPTVHVDDLAQLYLAAIQRTAPGAILHAITEPAVPASAIAAAADFAAGGAGKAEPLPVSAAAELIGAEFAEALALNQTIIGTETEASLDWHPTQPGIIRYLTQPSA